MKKIGDLLKQSREQQHLSIEDVAHRTKIHRYKLMSIEEGDKDALPAQVFAVGLIKSYARELKVDMNLIDELCREAYCDEPPPSLVTPPPTSIKISHDEEPEEKQPIGLFQLPKIVVFIMGVGLIAGLVVLITFISQKMESYNQESQESSTFVDIPVQTEEPAREASRENNSQAQRSTQAENEPAPKPKTDVKPAPEKVKAAEDKKVAPVKPTAVVEEKPAAITPPAPTPAPTQPEAATNAKPTSEPQSLRSDQKLMIQALEPVRIEILWADGYNQGLMLKRNESKTLIFSTPIRMRVDNGGAVRIHFNDNNRGVPGTLNQPIELSFP